MLLRVGDTLRYPGHRAWIAQDGLTSVLRGFGFLVRSGLITAIYTRSELNLPQFDFVLESRFVDALERLVAGMLDEDYRRW